MKSVAIIPAYNEENTLGEVIAAVKRSESVDLVVVISDGSTDRTADVARGFGADRVIELEQNHGKGGAMKRGIDQADADCFLFLDADLIGLRPEHVIQLVQPVQSGEVDMTVGVFDKGRVATDLAQTLAPYLSGQRAVTRDVLQGVDGMEMARFGVEVALTRHIKNHNVRVRTVRLPNVTHRMKEEKLGLLRGFFSRLKMYWEIVKYSSQNRQ